MSTPDQPIDHGACRPTPCQIHEIGLPSNISATGHLEASDADTDGVTTTSVKAFRHLE